MDKALIKKYTNKYKRRITPEDFKDLQQEAAIAMWKAMERFDETKGVLEHFIARCIKGAVLNFLRDRLTTIRTPRGSDPISTFDIYANSSRDDEEFLLIDKFVHQRDDLTELPIYIEPYVQLMTNQQREVIRMTYEGYSQREVSELLGISQMTVSREIQRVRDKIIAEGC